MPVDSMATLVTPHRGPLAARCLAREARVLGPKGIPFTERDIGSALAWRDLLADLRVGGEVPAGGWTRRTEVIRQGGRRPVD
jgi:uncharacterized protein YaiI (UPF0178 family)